MKPERWRQITDLYHAAIARDSAQRAPFLDEACGGDADLRRRVESLVRSQGEAGSFIETPAFEAAPELLVEAPASSMAGRVIGQYRVESLLGAGGMGEVYQARDTRLGRDVAIKVLPAAFTHDVERISRFEREARLLAGLIHPNVAVLHGFEKVEGFPYFVMELVPGQTLAERLEAGPLSIEEALDVCRQAAEALDAAHEQGIVHRDFKPANIKIAPGGRVKVLDFGLAKAFMPDASKPELSHSPTLSAAATGTGVILGTAGYMSPEQARGKPLDRRTDIWSFGCVLYEALTARRAFDGDTVSDAVAAILTREPDWDSLPAATPARVRELLRHCLRKDATQRLRDIGDARIELEEALFALRSQPSPTVAGPARTAPRSTSLFERRVRLDLSAALALGLAVAAAVAAGLLARRAPAAAPSPIRLVVAAPPDESFSLEEHRAIAISPDGQQVVFAAGGEGSRRLYLRPIDRFEATPLPGTEGAANPFFSPDSQWVGFSAEGKLKKVSTAGGPPLALCDAPALRGATWGVDDRIYFTPGFTVGLSRIPAAGGPPETLTTPDHLKGERTHRWPEVLANGKAVLFNSASAKSPDYYLDAQIVAQRLDTGERKVLSVTGASPAYVAGYIVYATAAGVLAARFDQERLEVTGSPVPVLDAVAGDFSTGAMNFAVSRTGTLLYIPGRPAASLLSTLAWADRKGQMSPLPLPPNPYFEPTLSPDGERVALTVAGPRNTDIWTLEIGRSTLTRLTYGPASRASPVWTPDGTRVAYLTEAEGKLGIFWRAADGSGPEERLTTSPFTNQFPESWTPDGRYLLYTELDLATNADLWVLPMEGDRKPRPLLRTAFLESDAAVSPNGRWFAYVSRESGSPEVYVQPFPGPGRKWRVSTGGGQDPDWSRSGRELFYVSGDRLMSVAVSTDPAFSASTPRPLFEASFGEKGPGPLVFVRSLYAVSPDGQRFLIRRGQTAPSPKELRVVLNWADELRRLAPPGGATAR